MFTPTLRSCQRLEIWHIATLNLDRRVRRPSWAKQAGAAAGRSAAQQIAHWAGVGREIEKSHNVATRDFADVLAGSKTYDSLSVPQQAVVRAEWTERIEALTRSLDCDAEFTAEERPYVETAQSGKVLHKGPGLDGE